MKASDIVSQLMARLPANTNRLTDEVGVVSVNRISDVLTVECDAPHALSIGHSATIVGAKTPIAISSLTRVGPIGTLVTAIPHDLTLSIAKTVVLSGAAEAEFIGTFSVLSVPSRMKITFQIADSGPTTATGSPILENGASFLQAYDGRYAVVAADTPTQFKVLHPSTSLPDPVGTIKARFRPRIARAISPERAIQAYTEQESEDRAWLFAVLGTVSASKNRRVVSDARDNANRGNFVRQQILQPFALYLITPTAKTVSGDDGRDVAEDLFRPICQSILHKKFDSGLSVGQQGAVQFLDHSQFRYDPAVYVHEYQFEQVVDLTFGDTVGHDDDVAFREIDLTQYPIAPGSTGASFLEATPINLDEE